MLSIYEFLYKLWAQRYRHAVIFTVSVLLSVCHCHASHPCHHCHQRSFHSVAGMFVSAHYKCKLRINVHTLKFFKYTKGVSECPEIRRWWNYWIKSYSDRTITLANSKENARLTCIHVGLVPIYVCPHVKGVILTHKVWKILKKTSLHEQINFNEPLIILLSINSFKIPCNFYECVIFHKQFVSYYIYY